MNDERNNVLWAPWRSAFVLAPKPIACFICEKPAEDRDRDNYILERGPTCFTILNLYPYNNGHLLISPYRHLANLTDLTDTELCEIMITTRRWVEILGRKMRAQGFNVGFNLGQVAGAGLAEHVHMHVVPRWGGDINCITVLSDTRVLSQSLDACWELLTSAG